MKKKYLYFFGLLGCGSIILGFIGFKVSRTARIIVEWSTTSEVDTAGFNIYRSNTAEGEYIQLNKDLLPGSPDPLIGGSYIYEDVYVIPGQVYYYQLEDVEIDGKTTQHGPIMIQAKNDVMGTLMVLASILFGVVSIIGFFCGLYTMRRLNPRV